jgi:hypothetical protein
MNSFKTPSMPCPVFWFLEIKTKKASAARQRCGVVRQLFGRSLKIVHKSTDPNRTYPQGKYFPALLCPIFAQVKHGANIGQGFNLVQFHQVRFWYFP